ncbi:MAG TPA: porin family protein [Gemmatimonadaceae bacterium]|nr:porin family protein [Gemmatimonadaceae bacterium]
MAIVASAALAAAPQARAQSTAKHATFGVIGAVNLTTFGGSDAAGAENKVGFSAGMFARVPMTEVWSFQPELEYAMKGAEETDNSSGTSVKASVDISYIEMPLLLRAAAPESPNGGLYAEFGPALAAKLDCTVSGSGGGLTVSFSCNDAGAKIKSFDLGAMAGLGYEFPIGRQALSIGVRYNYGLLELASDANTKNRALQFLGGFRF